METVIDIIGTVFEFIKICFTYLFGFCIWLFVTGAKMCDEVNFTGIAVIDVTCGLFLILLSGLVPLYVIALIATSLGFEGSEPGMYRWELVYMDSSGGRSPERRSTYIEAKSSPDAIAEFQSRGSYWASKTIVSCTRC